MAGAVAWRRSDALTAAAEPVTGPLEERLGATVGTEQLVKANAAVQFVGAGLFALGVWPRAVALVLAASLVPTTIAGHPFWEVEDDSERTAQRIQFLKNAGLLGGLIFAALDTGGRPSVFWSGRKAAEGAAATVAGTVASTRRTVTDTLDR